MKTDKTGGGTLLKRSSGLVAAAAFFVIQCIWAQTASAWNVSGHILCTNGTPVQGVTVTVCGTNSCQGNFSNGASTYPDGFYDSSLPGCPGCYWATLDTNTLPDCDTLVGPASVPFCTDDSNQTPIIEWQVVCGCQPPPPPPCTNCVDPALGLGLAAGMSVLELGAASVSITGPAGGILGDIAIAPKGKLSMSGSEFIAGTVRLGPGATFIDSSSGGVGAVLNNVDLSAQIAAAYAANLNDASMPCTQSFNVLDGKTVTVITGGPGINVICVTDINLAGKQILLTGPSTAKFIFNISGKFVLTGGGAGPQILVDGSAGIQSSAVLYNVLGSGPDVAFSGGGGGVTCCNARVDGTILAPFRKIALSPGLVNGEVISGMNISIVSGSSVRCPPCD